MEKTNVTRTGRKSSFNLFPEYSMMDILAHLDSFTASHYTEIYDTNMIEMPRKLAYFNLIDEFILYIFPISYGKGILLYNNFQRYD